MNIIAPVVGAVSTLPGLMTASSGYKPFRYPWAFEYWKRQQQIHWMPEEVPLGEVPTPVNLCERVKVSERGDHDLAVGVFGEEMVERSCSSRLWPGPRRW